MRPLLVQLFILIISAIILIWGCRSDGESDCYIQQGNEAEQADSNFSNATIKKLMSGMNSIESQ